MGGVSEGMEEKGGGEKKTGRGRGMRVGGEIWDRGSGGVILFA